MGYHAVVKLKLTLTCLIVAAVLFTLVSIINVPNQSMHTSIIAKMAITKSADGFYRYVLSKGINITKLSYDKFRISYLNWSCDINTSIALTFRKEDISWKDMFETRIEVLSRKTTFSPEELVKKMGVLPKDGTPVTLVARQGNVSIPEQNVIIRLNQHGSLYAKTSMVMTWMSHVKTISICAREQPNNEIIKWTHYKPHGNGRYYGIWNTSNPLVVPQSLWGYENLTYYRGPLFFMKGNYYFIRRFAECSPNDGIGLGAINRVANLKGDISTLGYSTSLDEYNTLKPWRFCLLSHKLPWAYFVVKELSDVV